MVSKEKPLHLFPIERFFRVEPWLPAIDGFRTTEAILLLRFYKHRKKGTLLSLIRPFEMPPPRPKKIYQNIIYE
jgi:hypothetical protein